MLPAHAAPHGGRAGCLSGRAGRDVAATLLPPPGAPEGSGQRPVHSIDHLPARSISAIAFHPDGHLLATAGADGTARLWHITDNVRDAPVEHGIPVSGR
ncbi:hypothetical protein ACFFMN_07550 [Planobispora siamensis]|uniref:WD40 repeat domain-containing protein n=1 Tax=Planobispora siamensis TaxID=936338 RepID=UPI00194ECECA